MINKMMLLLPFLFLQSLYCPAQQPGMAKMNKMELVNYSVITCFHSPHLDSLIKKTWAKDSTSNKDFFLRETKLASADFATLTASEKFIYAHQYPESYIQVCGIFDVAKDMSKIYANIPYLFDGVRKSERQRKSLEDNRDTTIACLRKCIDFDTDIPLTYKQTIIDLNAWEFVPFILQLESRMNKGNNQSLKDPYIYSLLMVLMKNNNFGEFKKTDLYENLYGPDAGYRASINFTVGIRNRLIDLSDKFYKWEISEKP